MSLEIEHERCEAKFPQIRFTPEQRAIVEEIGEIFTERYNGQPSSLFNMLAGENTGQILEYEALMTAFWPDNVNSRRRSLLTLKSTTNQMLSQIGSPVLVYSAAHRGLFLLPEITTEGYFELPDLEVTYFKGFPEVDEWRRAYARLNSIFKHSGGCELDSPLNPQSALLLELLLKNPGKFINYQDVINNKYHQACDIANLELSGSPSELSSMNLVRVDKSALLKKAQEVGIVCDIETVRKVKHPKTGGYIFHGMHVV